MTSSVASNSVRFRRMALSSLAIAVLIVSVALSLLYPFLRLQQLINNLKRKEFDVSTSSAFDESWNRWIPANWRDGFSDSLAIHVSKENHCDEDDFAAFAEAFSLLDNRSGIATDRSLYLDCPTTTDEQLRYLESSKSIRCLGIKSPNVSDKGVSYLRKLTELIVLQLDYTQVSDTGLKSLSGMKKLTSLGLQGTQISDSGLAHISRFSKLTVLDLAHTSVTDTGIAYLGVLNDLEMLDLSGTHITDKSVVLLGRLKRLKLLILNDTSVTPTGNTELAKILPKTSVFGP